MLTIHVLTLFPELFESFLNTSIVSRAIDNGLFSLVCHQLRDFSDPPHYKVDDTPYGGGGGMLLKPEPLAKAIQHIRSHHPQLRVVLLTPGGTPFIQKHAVEYAEMDEQLLLICGRYEGVDQRIIDQYVDQELSIGDYVLMGGELPAMVVSEAVLRLRPGVLGNEVSSITESFSSSEKEHYLALEAPHYTRPAEFEGKKVPQVLLSGDHKKIEQWRQSEALRKTSRVRPDLLPSPSDKKE